MKPIQRSGLDVMLAGVGCFGSCFQEPLVSVRLPGNPLVVLQPRAGQRCSAHPGKHFDAHHAQGPQFMQDRGVGSHHRAPEIRPRLPDIPSWNTIPFFKGQKKIVLRNCGLINPSDIEEYIAVGGYQALYKVLIDGRTDSVIEQIKAARLATRRRRIPHRQQVGFSWPRPRRHQVHYL